MKQPLIIALSTLIITTGCDDTDFYTGSFVGPSATAVALPNQGAPFSTPVGFVGNRKGGQISILALEDGRFQNDDAVASFVRGNPLAAGGKRIFSEITTWTTANRLTVFAGDQGFNQLLEIPYIVDVQEGRSIETTASATAPEFNDADGSGDTATLSNLMAQAGYTSTEDWTVEYQSGQWLITGSRSGLLDPAATSNEPYEHPDGILSFEITGEATDGDRFTFSTDSQLVEHDVGGMPIHLTTSPDQTRLAMVVEEAGTYERTLHWWNPSDQSQTLVNLPPDSSPGRMAWGENGQTLFIADGARPAVWSVPLGDAEPTEIPLPWTALDVAALNFGETPSLYIVPEDNRTVWRLDLDTGEFIDANPETTEVDGLNFGSFIRGIAAIPLEYTFSERAATGVQRRGRSVAISLYTGPIAFLDEETGCLIQDDLGPRTVPNSDFGSNYDYGINFEGSTGPFLQMNGANNRHVVVNPCSGIAKTEFWTATFDEIRQGWEVEGSASGIQLRLAYEDSRFVSDDGSISFVIRSGAAPSIDSQTIRFSVDNGAFEADGDNDKNGQINDDEFGMALPTRPVFFTHQTTPTDGGWQTNDALPYLLVASESGNFVTRINASEATLDFIWE